MSAAGFAKQCGVCHVGGGQMEYDRDMKEYGNLTSTDVGGTYTYRVASVNPDGSGIAGGIVLTSTNAANELYADNKAEVDCLMCHMNGLRTGAAWYKSMGCGTDPNMVGPADSLDCSDSRFTFAAGTIYDSFNRNIAVSLGYFKQAASAGIGALIDLSNGALSNVPSTIPAASITSVPNSENCAICHARTNSDNIGLPMEAAQYGGMVTGFGNFFRITAPDKAFDFDKIDALGACTDCANDTQWNEFGCKTGMGKRSQKTGVGTQDRFGFGVCLGCATLNAMNGDMNTGWFMGGICAMPSVQTSCNASAGTTLQGSAGQWMGIFSNPMTMTPKQIAGKMSDTDVHDASGMKCATCHYTVTADPANPLPARTITATVGGTSYTYTYPENTDMQKIDHQVAQGYSMLEKANDSLDGTVTCASCHIDGTHPNKGSAPIPAHAGFPAVHFEKIDCRTCHIPNVYSSPGRLLFRDWTTGAYRQADGSNGNANHFDFAFNFMEGAAAPMPPLKAWIASPEGTKIAPILPSLLPIWTGSAIRASDDFVLGWAPTKTRDITAAAALISAAHPELGIRLNGTNEHPLFQGFQLTDPMKIESKQKIDLMAAELATTGAGYATHGTVRDPRLNLFPTFFDPSHGIPEKEWALGSPSKGGCVMCHSSSDPSSPGYSPSSVGFFDGKKDLLKNGMMQMADYDCGGADGEMGGWSNAAHPDWMCGMFDGAISGTPDGTCDSAELMACKGYIGSNLFPQFGMPADIAGAFPIDGIDMMQMQAIREGATAAGCNPIYSFFGMPNATGLGHGVPGTNGCDPMLGDYYSRDEIRQHYKKNLQQSTFSPVVAGGSMVSPTTNAVVTVPSTMNRVFGVVNVGKNPSNAAHANKFDLGATCITNPMTGATGPCTNGGYVNTTVSETQLLGYSTDRQAALMDLNNCTACHSSGGPNGPVSMSVNHTTGAPGPTSCSSCHTNAHADGAPTAASHASCTDCHATIGGGAASEAQVLTRLTLGMHSAPVTLTFGYTTSGLTVNVDASGSANATGYDWDCGGGTSGGNTVISSCTYATGGTYTITLSNRGASVSHDVTAVAPDLPPAALHGTVTTTAATVSFNDASTDDHGVSTVSVNWGDGGMVSTGAQNGPFSHTYLRSGTFTVTHNAVDTIGQVNTEIFTVTANVAAAPTYSISGTVKNLAGTNLVGAMVTVKNTTTGLSKTAYSTASGYTVTGLKNGPYSIKVVKVPYTFSTTMTTTISGANVTYNIQSSN